MCLMKGQENTTCTHNYCALAAKKPDIYRPFHGSAIAKRTDFGSFKKIIGVSSDWIMAVNPYDKGTKERNEFESFRQGCTELMVHGDWPADREIFHRSEVSVEYVEMVNSKPINGKWIDYLDVQEAAVYIGAGRIIGADSTDSINPNEANPTVNYIRELEYLTPEQADGLLKMFDSKEAYAKNFTALKTIARGFFDLIQKAGNDKLANARVKKMFDTVNNLQGVLALDDMEELDSILRKNKL